MLGAEPVFSQEEPEIRSAMKLRGEDIPVFIIADTFNRVVYVVSGYTINLGETLLDIIHKL